MFYPHEEFDAQMKELIEQGYSSTDAAVLVQEQMARDEREYNEWRDEEEKIHAHDELERDWDEPYEAEANDSWYDDQYELDTDYF